MVAPNPFSDLLKINFYLHTAGELDVQLIDLNGRMVIDKHMFIEEQGNAEIRLTDEVAQLPAGLYILLIAQEGNVSRVKLNKE